MPSRFSWPARPAACVVLCLFCLSWLSGAVRAHQLQVEPVAVVLRPQETFIAAQFSGNVQDITQIPDVTLGTEARIGDRSPDGFEERLEKYVNEHFVLVQGGRALTGKITDLRREPGSDVTKVRFEMAVRYEKPVGLDKNAPLTITNTLFGYLPNALATVNVAGFQRNLKPGESQTVDPSALAVNLLTNVWGFFKEGMVHIFQGPDHILFILALLLVSPTLKGLIKTLTGFTIAHSITLVISTLTSVPIPSRLVDVLVAISIIYVGAENLFLKSTAHRFWMASGFGFIHGFAFAQNLRDIGLPEGNGLFWSLLSFNLGVEAAQVLLCSAAFPLLMLWKTSTERRQKYGGLKWESVVKLVSAGVIVMGAYWLVQRAFG
ncbi:MAG: HupE/UreJ family protein [Cytophagales bacterium]|nr:HupE/UreJ family protein [Armatimonadota bacterium]